MRPVNLLRSLILLSALIVVLYGCAGNADLVRALATDPAEYCASVMTSSPWTGPISVNIGRAMREGCNVTVKSDGCTLVCTPPVAPSGQ